MSDDWTPQIVGHRGARGLAPENTLPAFQVAADLRLPRAELDVRLSSDGCIVVIHDATVDKTTNGSGRVDDMKLGEIQAFDAAVHWSPRFAGTNIPTLDEVFERFAQTFHWQVELKVDDRTDIERLAHTTIDCIREHRIERVTLTGSSLEAHRYAGTYAPDTSRGRIVGGEADTLHGRLRESVAAGCDTVCVKRALLSADVVDFAHELGLFVVGWTGNKPKELTDLQAAHVDAVSSDSPEIALAWMRDNDIRPTLTRS
jgi:glycerophosphoryl diester phosphodiesterase